MRVLFIILSIFQLSACSFIDNNDISKDLLKSNIGTNQSNQKNQDIEQVKKRLLKNIYSSDYLYKFEIINQEDANFSYFRDSVNFGSVIFSVIQYLNEINDNSIYSKAEIISLIQQFDKYSAISNNIVIQKYFQGTDGLRYIFNPVFELEDGTFCFNISYKKHDTINRDGWFVYLPKYQIYHYYASKPDENKLSEVQFYDKEKEMIFLFKKYENLWRIYANNTGIVKDLKFLDLMNISFTDYVTIITSSINEKTTYPILINSLFKDLEKLGFSNSMNNATITACMFDKIIRDSL